MFVLNKHILDKLLSNQDNDTLLRYLISSYLVIMLMSRHFSLNTPTDVTTILFHNSVFSDGISFAILYTIYNTIHDRLKSEAKSRLLYYIVCYVTNWSILFSMSRITVARLLNLQC